VPYTDSLGRVWQADRYFLDGKAISECTADIPGTLDDPLWCTYRASVHCGSRACPPVPEPFAYRIPLTDKGQYKLTLYFSKLHQQNEVIVQVRQGGRHVLPLPNPKPNQSTPFTPSLPNLLSTVIPVYADNTIFTIQFQVDSILPAVAAIELERLEDTTLAPSLSPTTLAPTVSPDALPMRINAGYWPDERYIDAAGNHWGADRFYTGGDRNKNGCPDNVDPLYCSDHTGTLFEYNLPVPAPGQYTVTLFMAETRTLIATAPPRRFTIIGETKPIAVNYTIPVLDYYQGKTLTSTDVVTDGFYTIKFQGSATVSGIFMDYAK
jgi:Malectin domain